MSELSVTGCDQTVNGCDECPLEYDGMSCRHPLAPGHARIWEDRDDDGAPDWCPLRKGTLTVQLKVKDPRLLEIEK